MYKNWHEICKLGNANKLLMMAVATSDKKNHDSILLQKTFPDCFSAAEETGPVPLSVILRNTEKIMCEHRDGFHGQYFPETYDAIPSHIPQMEFWYEGSTFTEGERLPDSISRDIEIGSVFKWQGASFVVMENNNNADVNTITCVPAECIIVDC